MENYYKKDRYLPVYVINNKEILSGSVMTNQTNKIPFLRLLMPFIAGIILQDGLRISQDLILVLFLILTVSLLLVFILRKAKGYRQDLLFGILVNCTLCAGGMKLSLIIDPAPLSENLRSGYVRFIPEEKEESFKVVLGTLREKKSEGWHSTEGKVLVYMKKTNEASKLEPGDLIVFYGSLSSLEGPANPMQFDFRGYCKNLGIYWRTYLDEDDWKKLDNKKRILSMSGAEMIRLKFIRLIQSKKLVNESLVNALVLGYREGLTGEQQKYFAASGAMHILAVSGMHVAIIFGALVFFAGLFMRRKSGWILLFPLPIIWFYSFITGMTPSVARSAIMISLWVISGFLNREKVPLNIILASAFFMIMWQPSIIRQVSFQLSFAAVTGIALVFQGLYSKLKKGTWLVDQVLSICCLSLSAQLFTFPLSVYYFHQFPNYFLLTNLFAVPLSGFILITGFVFLISFFNPAVSSFLGTVLDRITGILDYLTRIAGTLPFSSTANIDLNTFEVITIYLVILFLFIYFRTKMTLSLRLALTVIALICGEICQKAVSQFFNKELLMLSVPGKTVFNYISGKNNLIIADDTSSDNKSRIKSYMVNYWCSSGVADPQYISLQNNQSQEFRQEGVFIKGSSTAALQFMQIGDIKIGILSDVYRTPIRPTVSMELDIIVINRRLPVGICELKIRFNPGMIIINRDTPVWVMKKIENECIEYRIPYHSIVNSGYFKLEI